jgi:hypothetical protein
MERRWMFRCLLCSPFGLTFYGTSIHILLTILDEVGNDMLFSFCDLLGSISKLWFMEEEINQWHKVR